MEENESKKNEENKDGNESKTNSENNNQQRIEINKKMIPSIDIESNLQNLGVSAYNSSTFENSVMNQFDDQFNKINMAKESRKLIVISNNITSVKNQIARLNNEKKEKIKKKENLTKINSELESEVKKNSKEKSFHKQIKLLFAL